jgi:uroporphyrinogen-III synthase
VAEVKIKSILVSQPKPESEKNPYTELAKKYNVKIDFRPFIHVEGIDSKEIRKHRINILDYSAVIFNSRNGIDHFFNLVDDLRINIPDDMKYFCVTEAVALYLQKYIVYRKRKIFHGQSKFEDLLDVIKKNKDERYLFPCSDKHQESVTEVLDKMKVNYSKAIIYKTVSSDLSDLTNVFYDMLVFFSPMGIDSLFHNYPDFVQGTKTIATFGSSVKKAAEDRGLVVKCFAPSPNAPSMTMAIDQYLAINHGKK